MHIALGVTGCIGAYKAAGLVREFQKSGIRDITVIMTDSAQRFITPHTFDALTNRRTITEMWDRAESREISHISLAREADILLVAPATANIIGKFANAIADDFLSTFYLAIDKPVFIAPAMNKEMWGNIAVQENIIKLKERGVTVIDPDEGYLACGEVGAGRLATLEKIVSETLDALKPEKPLLGKKVIVTAGPTREPIDPVRFLSNPSTGKMGYAIAREAVAAGANVALISGPTLLRPPENVRLISIETALEMKDAVEKETEAADILIMSAAVADFRPVRKRSGKTKKNEMPSAIQLEKNPDILLSLKDNKNLFKVGFAAESDDLEKNAEEKLKRKKLDIIIANDITAPGVGFASDTNSVLIIDREGVSEKMDRELKEVIARRIISKIVEMI